MAEASAQAKQDNRPIRIRRAKHGAENAYFLAARATAQDRNLTYEARGVLFYLLSKPGDWIIRVADIKQVGAGRDKVYRILGELEEFRYLSRDFIRDKNGIIKGMEYICYETPFPENPDTAKPDTAKPDTAEPDTANTDHTDKRGSQNTEDKQNTDQGVAAGAAAHAAISEREKLGLEPPAEGVLDALCVLLYDDLDGWKLNAWRIQKLYNEIASKFSPPTLENVRAAYAWWFKVDFRGRDNDSNPTPAQLVEKWSIAIKYDYKRKGKVNRGSKQANELLGKQGGGSGWGVKSAKPKE